MTDTGRPIPSSFPIRQSLTVLATVWAAFATLCLATVFLLGHDDAWPVVIVTGAVCGLSSAIALLPLRIMSGHSPEGAAQGALVGVMVRMFLTLAGAAAVFALSPWRLEAVAGWTVGWYLLLLSVEVTLIVRYFQAAYQSVHTTEGSACSAR
ncbi:MAG: hypothetical protein WC058_12235 [Phycisphaeraceae bacterium]